MKTAPIYNNIMQKVEILKTTIMASFDKFVERISTLHIQEEQIILKLDVLDYLLLNFARVIGQEMQWFTDKINENLRNQDEQQIIKKCLQHRITMYSKHKDSMSQKIPQKIIIDRVPDELVQFSRENPSALFLPNYKQIGKSKIQQICYKKELYNLQQYFQDQQIQQMNRPQLLLQLAFAIYELNSQKFQYINPSNIAIIRELPLLIQIQKKFWAPHKDWTVFNCQSSVQSFLINFSYIISSDFRQNYKNLLVSSQITCNWVKNDRDGLANLFRKLVNEYNNQSLTNMQDVLLKLIKFINHDESDEQQVEVVQKIIQSNSLICLKHNKILKYAMKQNSACIECLVEQDDDSFEFLGGSTYFNKNLKNFCQKLQHYNPK